MKVTRESDMTVYNLDKKKIQKLVYPSIIEMSDASDDVASMIRDKNAPENLKFWAHLILSAAQDITSKDSKYLVNSSQAEGGYFVMTRPDNVAFFNCNFKHGSSGVKYLSTNTPDFKEFERIRTKEGLEKAFEYAKKVSRENFGFSCSPVSNDEIGPDNWLYGHMYRSDKCKQLYDRKDRKVIDASQRENFPVQRYWCGVRQEEIDHFVEAWKGAQKQLQEYDDIIRFNWEDLKRLPMKERFDMKETLMTQFQKEEDEQKKVAMLKFVEYMATKGKIDSAEEFRKLFVKRYGHMPF